MSTLTYQYTTLDRAGAKHTGVLSAASRAEALRKLAATGATPLNLKPVRERKALAIFKPRSVAPRDVAQIIHQLSVLLQARIALPEGVRSIAEQESNPRLRAALLDVASRMQAGATFTAALSHHPAIFSRIVVESVRAAEASGNIIKVLEHLAEMLEQQQESRHQVKQALTYPVIVLIALSSATLFLIAVVVPKFASMFEARGMDLPFLTRALQAFGLSLRSYWWAYALAASGLVFALRRAKRSQEASIAIDRFLHRVPYLSRVLTALAVSRFARVLGISLSSGLGLIESIDMSSRAAARPLLRLDAASMIDQVRNGGRLSDVLRACPYIPSFARRMLAAGEESAELPRMCDIVARQYERDASRLIKNSATVIEPLLIAVLTTVVMIVALAIFLPMWDMVALMG